MRPLSARNPRIQRLGRLARRRGERAEQRAFVVEGPVLVAAALDAGRELRELYVAEGAVEDSVRAVIDRAEASGSTVWSVPDGVLERVGDTRSSQGVIGVVTRTRDVLAPADASSFVVLLGELADPGNVGTLMRAAVAAGADAVAVAGGVDPTNPKVVRASAGAVFAVPIIEFDDLPAAIDQVTAAGFRTVGTVVRDGAPYDEVDLTGPTALVMGNEAHGLDDTIASALDERVTIPMAGPTESLNVAMAGTIICFEILRQRRSLA